MIKRKNYYEILGVTPDSDEAEIKASYRRLARKYHPDVNPDKEDLFKAITEAYEVLSNKMKRAQYDTLNGFFKSQKTNTSSQKAEQEYKFNSSEDPINNKKNSEEEKLKNRFSDFWYDFKKTSNNFDKKKEKISPVNGDDIFSDITISLKDVAQGTTRTINIMHTVQCPLCKGRKFINGAKCTVCSGKGDVSDHKKITVKIPKNVKNGAKLRISGEGNPGKNGGKNGDLFLKIKVETSSKIKYEGLNIYYELPITPFEAVLGGDILVPTFEGNVKLKLPKQTNSGQKFRLAGQGLVDGSKIGDLIVTVHIEIPCSLSDDEIKLYEKLKKLSQQNIRENLLNG